MWDEVKGSEQGQPQAGDCSFLLRAVAINIDWDLRKKKKGLFSFVNERRQP